VRAAGGAFGPVEHQQAGDELREISGAVI